MIDRHEQTGMATLSRSAAPPTCLWLRAVSASVDGWIPPCPKPKVTPFGVTQHPRTKWAPCAVQEGSSELGLGARPVVSPALGAR